MLSHFLHHVLEVKLKLMHLLRNELYLTYYFALPLLVVVNVGIRFLLGFQECLGGVLLVQLVFVQVRS